MQAEAEHSTEIQEAANATLQAAMAGTEYHPEIKAEYVVKRLLDLMLTDYK